MPGEFDPEVLGSLPEVFQPDFEIGSPGFMASPFGIKIGEQPVEKIGLEVGEVVPQGLTLSGQRGDFGVHLVVGVAFGQQRLKGGELGLGAPHRLVRLGEILEMRDDILGPPGRIEWLEHMVADEIGEVPHRFHRNRLMEQLHRLL